MELAHVLQTTQLTVKSHRTTVTDLISRNKSGICCILMALCILMKSRDIQTQTYVCNDAYRL